MKLRTMMSSPVIRIDPKESVAVAARILTRYNVGALPVCTGTGRVCGIITDRDIVTRCLAQGRAPAATPVEEVMSRHVISATPEADTRRAMEIMGEKGIRRLPVMENEKLCGMVSLADLAEQQGEAEYTGKMLAEISKNIKN